MVGIGIDFGTSNSLVAKFSEDNKSETISISQHIEEFTIHSKRSLPSCVYFKDESNIFVGSYARSKSLTEPEKTVSSVKSWLCNNLVSRTEEILPWTPETQSTNGNNSNQKKYTPVEISTLIIKHLINELKKDSSLKEALENNNIKKVLTIPASFDEVARELTKRAAISSDLKDFLFLEEPLAALYAWLSKHSDNWREHLVVGDLILVCDIGGGTTDFTLVGVAEEDGNLSLDRLSVGEHILLGGDNIDHLLLYFLEEKLSNEGTQLDHWQKMSSVQILRECKEKILSEDTPLDDTIHIAIPSKSGNLFTTTKSVKLPASFFIDNIFESFFPIIELNEEKLSDPSAISDSGLPFESDPRFSIHLLNFLKQSYRTIISSEDLKNKIPQNSLDEKSKVLIPNKILFNGGVCNAHQTRDKILKQLNKWFSDVKFSELPNDSYDESVAKGASYYSYLKSSGSGIPIKAGISHSLYLGVKENRLAIPGVQPKLKGICVLPQGANEGSEFVLDKTPLALKKGVKAEFVLYKSKERLEDVPGATVIDAEKNLERYHTVTSFIQEENNEKDSQLVPVVLRVKATESGSLELWMDEVKSSTSHQVEFQIR